MMAEQPKIVTGIGKAELHRILVRGYDLNKELVGKITFTDMTWDSTAGVPPPGSYAGSVYPATGIAPNGMHPDSHAMVEIPGTDSAIFGSDGGLVRSSGSFADISLAS